MTMQAMESTEWWQIWLMVMTASTVASFRSGTVMTGSVSLRRNFCPSGCMP